MENKYGHWIDDGINWICSNCFDSYSREIEFLLYDSKTAHNIMAKYCPNCGVRMVGEYYINSNKLIKYEEAE